MKSSFSHLIGALMVCIIVSIGYGMWYVAISEKSMAVEKLQNVIDTKTETVSRIATTRATLAGVANDETVVQGYFVPETKVVTFIDSLETHGKTQGAIVKVLSVSTTGTTAQPTLSLSLVISGTFDAVMRTVGTIEYAPYALSISTLSVLRDAKDSWHADLKVLVGSLSAIRAESATTALIPFSSTHVIF
ncbi:MAG: hypothetical protein NUV60_00385 [Patescibacteria group bacterium]|nr:hypothetical protein [Patescibacteria group bacterium]